MKRYGGFEANAQNVRIITKLESKSHRYEGLNLTRAVIDGQMKYKHPFAKCRKKYVYADDLEIVKWAGDEARAVAEESCKGLKSFECEIMDWADKVAYAVHDLEDSIHTGYIREAHFLNRNYLRDAAEQVNDKFRDCALDVPGICYSFVNEHILTKESGLLPLIPIDEKVEQKIYRKMLTSHLIGRYIKATGRVDSGCAFDSPVSMRYLYRLHIPNQHQIEVAFINQLINDLVFESPQIRTLEQKGKHIIRSIFEEFMQGKNAEHLLPYDWRRYLRESCSVEGKARVVSDYIAGMTDGYAQRTYAKLFLPHQGSIYEVL